VVKLSQPIQRVLVKQGLFVTAHEQFKHYMPIKRFLMAVEPKYKNEKKGGAGGVNQERKSQPKTQDTIGNKIGT
jgi:hypothetical protein